MVFEVNYLPILYNLYLLSMLLCWIFIWHLTGNLRRRSTSPVPPPPPHEAQVHVLLKTIIYQQDQK